MNMLVGLMLSSSISLTRWIPYALLSRALQTQSVQRRFARWLNNKRIDVRCGLDAVVWRLRLEVSAAYQEQFLGRRGHGSALVEQLLPKRPGKAVFLHNVHLTGQRHGPVHLALARPGGDDEDPWLIVSDELSGLQTFEEYGLRFDIEEHFLDDKSNGFQG